ncbi:hypothetical protein PY257_13205 [Ramlibacter sp. H39-3-26]|uniref:hypothetical protein n=1 Tax=Curvibacter soli TaxID=3031331 RepID=UPI0023D9C12C|nr:hypothetical protein [Ramlibacter sp. H39-3-26]MDF1486126.1 hypothetical protein [Ramlibacter sp. H39-3-26]
MGSTISPERRAGSCQRHAPAPGTSPGSSRLQQFAQGVDAIGAVSANTASGAMTACSPCCRATAPSGAELALSQKQPQGGQGGVEDLCCTRTSAGRRERVIATGAKAGKAFTSGNPMSFLPGILTYPAHTDRLLVGTRGVLTHINPGRASGAYTDSGSMHICPKRGSLPHAF